VAGRDVLAIEKTGSDKTFFRPFANLLEIFFRHLFDHKKPF
jgi:hypothetical protein